MESECFVDKSSSTTHDETPTEDKTLPKVRVSDSDEEHTWNIYIDAAATLNEELLVGIYKIQELNLE